MDSTDHEDILWLHTELTSHVNGLSGIYEHIAFAIRRLQDEKTELQNRVLELEHGNPSAEVRRLRDQNSVLRAKLAAAAKETSEVARERDALFRKLNSIKQLIDGTAPLEERDAKNHGEPSPRNTITGTVRPQDDAHAGTLAQHSSPTTSQTHTDISEPRTDVTTVNDTFGRIVRPNLPQHPRVASTSENEQPQSQSTHPLSAHTSVTLVDDSRVRSQGTVPRAFAALFDSRSTDTSPALSLSSPAPRRLNNVDPFDSPLRGAPRTSRNLSLSMSPRTNEGLSLLYDEGSRSESGPSGTRTGTGTVQKWKIHFAKPPSSGMVVAPAKLVTTAALVQNLELAEEVRGSIEALSSEPAGSLRLYICDVFGLAFLYDPIFIESPEAMYVVEWCEVKASQKSRAYITTAKEKHTDLHTFTYAPRKSGWYYLGQQRWNLTDIRSIWKSLGAPARRALAERALAARSQDVYPEDIALGLERGQIEQLTIELQQVSLIEPSPGESVLMEKLRLGSS